MLFLEKKEENKCFLAHTPPAQFVYLKIIYA